MTDDELIQLVQLLRKLRETLDPAGGDISGVREWNHLFEAERLAIEEFFANSPLSARRDA
jgi:hypothetical protein